MFVDNKAFLILDNEIPTIPMEFSMEARQWWGSEKKFCIEGKFAKGDVKGHVKWMSPNLYFYVNFWKILLNKTKESKTKSLGRPLLRDIEWQVFTAWALARGLSGFDNISIPEGLSTEEKMEWLWNIPHKNPGSPLYNNEAYDLMLMGPRDFGKSEMVAGGVIAHEFLFNGVKRYYLPGDMGEEAKDSRTMASRTIVGAGATSFSSKLLNTFKFGYDVLAKQGIEFGKKYYPHPFIQEYDGSLTPNKWIVAQYEKKIGGEWKVLGTKSEIRHVAYKDNPFAGQGNRNTVMVKEEIGEFDNIVESQENDLETMKNGTRKSGSCFYIGTGGNMKKGTLGAYKMFYSPKMFKLLPFKDKWENKGEIGMFVPGTMRYNDFRDKQGNVDHKLAYDFCMWELEELKKQKNSKAAVNKHRQYNPMVPSEIFLRGTGGRFATQDINRILADLETSPKKFHFSQNVDLIIDDKGQVDYRPNDSLSPIVDFPLPEGEDTEGCVVIYEPPKYIHPESPTKYIPQERYIAACDPVLFAQTQESKSLSSTFVLDTWTNKISAEYVGKPQKMSEHYENIRRLLKLYSARLLYDNATKGLFEFFEYNNELHLLVNTPPYLKDIIPNTTVDRGKGAHFDPNGQVRGHCEEKLWEWLTQKTGNTEEPERMNMHNIRSLGLLRELRFYDSEGNFDRVDAMLLLMLYLRDIEKYKKEELKYEKTIPIHQSAFFSAPLFSGRKRYIN